MYGLVKVLEDGVRHKHLLFASKEGAQAFVRFSDIYIAESGAGNGYGAYWHYTSNPVVGVDAKMGNADLRWDLIHDMARDICNARRARSVGMEPEYTPSVGQEDGTITFEFNEGKLPPRLQPEVGDLARVVEALSPCFRRDARVTEVHGEAAVLDFGPYADERYVTVVLAHIMKIYDYERTEA